MVDVRVMEFRLLQAILAFEKQTARLVVRRHAVERLESEHLINVFVLFYLF